MSKTKPTIGLLILLGLTLMLFGLFGQANILF